MGYVAETGVSMDHGIVGGNVSIPHSRPYMVYIRDKYTPLACGGFLIREDFVMTAAHCKRDHLMVYLGVHDTNHLPAGIPVDAFLHPNFDSKNLNNDIMLLKLKTPGTLNKTVNIIALPENHKNKISRNCMVMGWGLQEYNGKFPSRVLREVNLTRLPSKNCATHYTLCTKKEAGPALQRSDKQSLLGVGIVGGKVSIPHSHPYMVYIRDTQTHSACGGFLIREDFVMTTASCKRNHLMAYLGVNDTNDLPEGIEVDAFPHPNFNSKNMTGDIMLLKLKTPGTLNKTVNIITLPKNPKNKISRKCMVMGWGLQKYNGKFPSRVLKEVNLTVLRSKNCAIRHNLCTQDNVGPAPGDSGGPLICGKNAVGIVSYYIMDKSTSYLTMYTNISHYLPWIHKISENMIAHSQEKRKPGIATPDKQEQPKPGMATPDKQEQRKPVIATPDKQEQHKPVIATPDKQEQHKPGMVTPDKQEQRKPVIATPDKQEQHKPGMLHKMTLDEVNVFHIRACLV
nr:transmembrane protease serine 11B-like protein [Misgurnus anguillicaudatus]